MPTNNKKNRIQDIAEDLRADRSQIIAMLDEAFPQSGSSGRRAQTTLSSEEISYLLEKFMRSSSVNTFEQYEKMTKDVRTERPAPVEKKTRKKAEPKAETKPEAPKAEEKPEAPRGERKPDEERRT